MSKKLIGVLSLLVVFSSGAAAQTYPSKPVRIIVGFGPGGPDTVARLFGQQLTSQTGQSFIVENRPGASGIIGANFVAKAPADGYTLLVSSSTLTINPSIYKNLPFDVRGDFAPISQLTQSDAWILAVTPSLPAHSVKELIDLARKPESKVAYGSSGVGSGGHLVSALFNSRAKTNMLFVPYKSASAATTALVSGEIQVLFVTPTESLPLIKSGKIRALAYDNDTRASFLPDVPTLAEAGSTPSNLSAWHGIFAPAKTPPDVLARLESELKKAVANTEIRQRIEKLGLVPVGSSSLEFRALVDKSVTAFAQAVTAAKIEPEAL